MTDAGRRYAGLCGMLAFVTFNAGWVAGDATQPAAFSPTHNDISDLGALTASNPWLYNQLAANLSGLLLIVLGVGLWRALAPNRGWVGVLGSAAVIGTGLGMFADGLFRLDCQPIDTGCSNDSWHSHAHKLESGFTAAATILSLLLLAFVLRRLRTVRWRPLLGAFPALIAANIVFSAFGDGAATRAGTVMAVGAFAYVGAQLAAAGGVRPFNPQSPRRAREARPRSSGCAGSARAPSARF